MELAKKHPYSCVLGVKGVSKAVITMCILQKAYETTSLWSKWILLASLDELLGKPAPLLNETQLQALLGVTINSSVRSHKCDKYMTSTKDVSLISNIICFKCKSTIQASDKNIQCNLPLENSLVKESLWHNASVDSLNISKLCPLNKREIKNVAKKPEVKTEPNDNSIGMVIDNSNATLLSQNGMTELKDTNDTKILITLERKERCCAVQSTGISQYTQTVVVPTADKSVNTEIPYKLRKINDPNIELRYDTKKAACHQYRLCIKKEKIKLFHGRPLILPNSSMRPAIIPMQRMLPELDMGDLCLDPRVERPEIKEEKSLSLEDINSTLMDISSCDDSVNTDNVKEEGNNMPTPV